MQNFSFMLCYIVQQLFYFTLNSANIHFTFLCSTMHILYPTILSSKSDASVMVCNCGRGSILHSDRMSLSTSSQLCLNLVFPVDNLKKYPPYPTSHNNEKTSRHQQEFIINKTVNQTTWWNIALHIRVGRSKVLDHFHDKISVILLQLFGNRLPEVWQRTDQHEVQNVLASATNLFHHSNRLAPKENSESMSLWYSASISLPVIDQQTSPTASTS